MIYDVTAYAADRKTGNVISPERVEEIDVDVNILFKNCITAYDVKVAYEAFWNEMNKNSVEVVYVTKVEIYN